MKYAVVYFSRTGHSQKIAKAVASALKVAAEDITGDPTLSGIDLLFIVGGIYGGVSDPKLLQFVDRIEPDLVKKAALVTSSAGGSRGQEKVREILERNGIEVLKDEYRCRGNFLLIGLSHPKQAEIDGAAAFARKTAALK
jgi:flavodoxin